MVKKVKENEPNHKNRPGKCANINSTTLLFFVISNCVQLVKLLPHFMRSKTI